MSRFNLALPPRLPTARVASNGTVSTNSNIVQGHPDKFPCVECSSHFANAAGRATHMRDAHAFEDGFLCHECMSSHCDQAQHTRHVNDHFRSRFGPPQRTCPSLKCDYQSSSTDVLERHRRDDHLCDGSHHAQCPECTYHNDSIVGVSVHMLHVHSREGAAKRKEALQLKRERELEAKRAARAAKQARIEESRAAVNASGSNAESSPAETAPDSESSPPAAAASKKRSREDSPRMTAEEQRQRDANAANSNAFLASQMAVYDAMTEDERKESMLRHGDRKRLKKARARGAGSS